jgi:hypothetical protein
VKVEIAGKTATTDNAGYYVVSNVIPNTGDKSRGESYSVSFYKDGYTAAQNADIYVDPDEYKDTDPYLEKQILLKLEDYFNTWLTQSAGNGTKIVTGRVTGNIQVLGTPPGVAIAAGPPASSFWGTVNDAGDILGGTIQGTLTGASPLDGAFSATVTGGNINLGNITISGSMTGGSVPGTAIEANSTNNPLTITNLNITSAAGGNWTYAGGVYINEEDGTAVQVTSDPQNPEVPKFELKPLDYVYHYGQSLETVYLYPMNASISGKILTFHNNADVPVGVPNIKIEFSNMPNPVVGDQLYTASVGGNIKLVGEATNVAVTPATFVGYYNPSTTAISGTINGVAGAWGNFTGTVSGTFGPYAITFSGKRADGRDIENDTGNPLSFTPANFSPVGANTNQAGRFYGEGKTNAKGEFTVKGVPAGQALYIQIPGFTDSQGRYYSGTMPFSVSSDGTTNQWAPFSTGPWVSQRNATVALPTIYLKADADIALVVGSELGTPRSEERLPIKAADGTETLLTVSFSKEMDIKTFSAFIRTGDGAKISVTTTDIHLDVVKWEDTGTGSKAIKNSKVTLKADRKKIPDYYQSGLLPYWTGDATKLSIGTLQFDAGAKAADGSVLVDPLNPIGKPQLPVYTEIGLNLEKVEVIEASKASRSVVQQGGEIRLYFNKEVVETEGTKFYIAGVEQAWRVFEDDPATPFNEATVVHVYNDRPIATGSPDLVTTVGTSKYPVRSKQDNLNDYYEIKDNEVSGLATWNADLENLTILVNPYLGQSGVQNKLNAKKVKTNVKLGDASANEWDPLKDIVLEFNKALKAATHGVSILYSPSEGEYIEAYTSTITTVADATELTIALKAAAYPLLAPGQTYYLAIEATADDDDELVVDPRESGSDIGPNIIIAIPEAGSNRFNALDSGKTLEDYDLTFDLALPEQYQRNITFKDATYSTDAAGLEYDVTVQLYVNRPNTDVWEAIGDPFTIPAGNWNKEPIPEFTINSYNLGGAGYQFRGLAGNGTVLKIAGTLPTITAPEANFIFATGSNIYTNNDITTLKNVPLVDTPYIGIELTDTTFLAFAENESVKAWFKNLPEGIDALVASEVVEGATEIAIKLTGTPTGETFAAEDLEVVVPDSAVKFGANIDVEDGNSTNLTIALAAPKANIVSIYQKGVSSDTIDFAIGSDTALAGDNVILELELSNGNKFAKNIATTEEITEWFVNLPIEQATDNFHVYPRNPVTAGEDRIEVVFSGSPTIESNQTIQVKIPSEFTLAAADIYVDTVAQYEKKYAVTRAAPGTAEFTAGTDITTPAGLQMPTQYFTITLTGDTFNTIQQNTPVTTEWSFSFAGTGLTATTTNRVLEGASSVVIKVEGRPTAVKAPAPISFVIPAGYLKKNLAIKGVVGNPPKTYEFTAAPTASIILSNPSGVVQGSFTTPGPTPISEVSFTIQLSTQNRFNLNEVPQRAVRYELDPIRNWIPNAPLGLKLYTQGVQGSSPRVIIITVGGAPIEPSTQQIEFRVPAAVNQSNQDINIALDNTRRFNITPSDTIVTASVTGRDISIVQGVSLTPNPVDFTITLTNDKFKALSAGTISWFTGLGTFTQRLLYPVVAGQTSAVVRVEGSNSTTGVTNLGATILASDLQDSTVDLNAYVPFVSNVVAATATATTDVIVTGTVGTAITAKEITITLENGNTFNNASLPYAAGTSIIGWIPVDYRVGGLDYKLKNALNPGDTSVILEISGAPGTANTDWIVITIPGSEVESGLPITIPALNTRRYDITNP